MKSCNIVAKQIISDILYLIFVLFYEEFHIQTCTHYSLATNKFPFILRFPKIILGMKPFKLFTKMICNNTFQ